MNYPKISIIIINWNGLNDTIACLESVKKIKYPNYDIWLVDNGSENDESNILKKRYSDIAKVLLNKENLGFTGGNNTAIEQILIQNQSNYILLLNNDTTVDPYFLNIMVKAMQNDPKIAIAGPKIYYSNLPDKTIQAIGGYINYYSGKIKNIGYLEKDVKQYNKKILNVDYVPGCALLIKTEVVKQLGLLPKKYFAYWEEVAWCSKAKKIGYKIIAVAESCIFHKEYASSKKRSAYTDYLLIRNRFFFMKDNASQWQYFIFNLYFWLFTVPMRIIKRQNLNLFFQAIKDGYNSV